MNLTSLNPQLKEESKLNTRISLRQSTFKRRYRLSQKDVNKLLRKGYIQIQQGGYKGHSTAHPKILVFSKDIIPRFTRTTLMVEQKLKRKQQAIETRLRRLEVDFRYIADILLLAMAEYYKRTGKNLLLLELKGGDKNCQVSYVLG